MVPLRTEGSNRAIGKPEDWDEEARGPCDTLWIQDMLIDETGTNLQISTWTFATPQERQDFIDGKSHIRLAIQGYVHPVVRMWLE